MKTYKHKILLALTGLAVVAGCGDTNPAEGIISPIVGVSYVRDLYNGDDVVLQPDLLMGANQIAGQVISDASGGNVGTSELVLQNVSKGKLAGISLDFGTDALAEYLPGDSIKIDITAGVLTRKNGTLKITGLNKSGITKVISGLTPLVRTVAVSELYSNFQNYESTLVQVNNAGIDPAPVGGEVFAGDKKLDDGTGGNIFLSTETDASFANNSVPMNATFVGIATYLNATKNTNVGARQLLKIRNERDISNASGSTYANFPETFEFPVATEKSAYDMPAIDNTITLKSGSWKLEQSVLGAVRNSDRFNSMGFQAVRMQKDLTVPALLQMNFDLPKGASKVSLVYGSYATDPSSTWRLEYSQDGGTTWEKIAEDVTDASSKPKLVTFNVNIKGPVRFRVNKLGLGKSNIPFLLNGQLNIEDFTVYQNVD